MILSVLWFELIGIRLLFFVFFRSSTIHLGVTRRARPRIYDEEKESERKDSGEWIDAINQNAMGRSFSIKQWDPQLQTMVNDLSVIAEDISVAIEDIKTPNTAENKIDDDKKPFTPYVIHRRPCDDSDDEKECAKNKETEDSAASLQLDLDVVVGSPKSTSPSLTSPTSYIGENEDNEWWKEVPPKTLPCHDWIHPDPEISGKENLEKVIKRKEDNKKIYQGLADGMGTFRYQNA